MTDEQKLRFANHVIDAIQSVPADLDPETLAQVHANFGFWVMLTRAIDSAHNLDKLEYLLDAQHEIESSHFMS